MDKTQYNRTAKDVIVVVLKYAVVVGALAYLILSGKLQWRYLWVAAGNYHLVALAVCLQLLVYLFSFVRYKFLLKGVGLHIELSDVIAIGFIGAFFGIFMFGNVGGDMAKLTYIARETGKKAEVVASIMADRFLGVLGLFVLGGIAIFWNWPEVLATPGLHSLTLALLGAVLGTGFAGLVCLVSLTKGRRTAGFLWLLVVGIIATTAAVTTWGEEIAFSGTASDMALLYGRMFLVLAVAALASLCCGILVPELAPGGRIAAFITRCLPLGGKITSLVRSVLAYRNHSGILLGAFGISVLVQFVALLALYLFSQAIQLERPPTIEHVFYAAPLAIATGSLPLPGSGLGVGEVAFDQLLSRCRTKAYEPIEGGAGVFLMARCWGVILSLIGLPFYLRSKRRLSRSILISEMEREYNSNSTSI